MADDAPEEPGDALGIHDSVTVEIGDGSPLRPPELLAAYLRAVERLRTHDLAASADRSGGRRDLASAAICEALEWADTLEQHLSHPPRGVSRGWVAAPDGDDAVLLRAFGHLRNVVHHRWWKALAFRLPGDGSAPTEVWGALPASAKGGAGRSREGASAYEEALRGRVVLATLDELAGVFWPSRGWAITLERLEQPGHGVGTPVPLDP